jgi:hypothetical protein
MAIEIFWGPSCGNDRLAVTLVVPPEVQPNIEQIAAPGGALLFGIAALPAFRGRRRAAR